MGEKGYGKKKKGKTKNTKSPIDDFDSNLGDGIQLSLPIKTSKATKINPFRPETTESGQVNDNIA